MWLDLEEFFPPRTELIGLQLASDDDFERCKALLDTDSELYRELYTHWRIIVIRESDMPRLAHLRLRYTDIEQIDPTAYRPTSAAVVTAP